MCIRDRPVAGKLKRGLTQLDQGEKWLVKPEAIDEDRQLWTPGIKLGVKPDSWFAKTECFGPILGIVEVETLADAIKVQNSSAFGLTGGIQSLNHEEIKTWLDAVQVGNAYVNKSITGAIVQRQPFGGWKASSVGPGAKAGGPNYVAQLGTWQSSDTLDADWLATAKRNDLRAWREEFSVAHDPTGFAAERNILRYVPRGKVMVRCGDDTSVVALERVTHAAEVCGVELLVSAGEPIDTAIAKLERSTRSVKPISYVICLEPPATELLKWGAENFVHIDTTELTSSGHIELLKMLKEQALSITNHRFGNFTNQLEI